MRTLTWVFYLFDQHKRAFILGQSPAGTAVPHLKAACPLSLRPHSSTLRMLPTLPLERSLPLVPDHILILTRRAYERALTELCRPDVPIPRQHVAEIEDMLIRVNAELRARGIGAMPWWASDEAA